MPSITAVSGEPTKNHGATIVNAGNTPAGPAGKNDVTNNNAGLGILTGSNAGKSSGSKVVERDGAKQSPASGISFSAPGVQVATTARQFASPTVGATTAPGLPGAIGQIQRFNVSWKNILRQHPTERPSNKYTFYHNEYTASIEAGYLGADTRGTNSVKRNERAEFGTSVQIAKNPNGIMLSVGSPSGNYSRDFGKSREGFVDSWVYGMHAAPEFPGQDGTIDGEGYATFTDEECKWHPNAQPYHCPGWLNGFTRTGSRITQTSQSDEATPMPQFDKRRRVVVSSGTGTGHCIAYNSDATRMAVGMPYANEETGEVRVYEFIGKVDSSGTPREGRGIWARCGGLITGNQKGDRFGYSVALDGVGNTLFVGAPRPKGSGYVSVQEYSSNVWAGAAGASSGVSPRDRYGHSVTCNSAGTAYAAGAPNGSGTRGYAQIMAYFGNWMTTRRGKYTAFKQSQQTEQDNGKSKVQRIVGTASGERLGWSVDMMYKSVPSTKSGKYNLRLAVGSPYYSRSVAEYNFDSLDFHARAAGVPISDGNQGSESGEKPWHSQDYLENGIAYDKVGLSSEGRIQVWGYSGPEMTQTSKFAYTALEFIHFGKSSSKTLMIGTQGSELGYSVKISDDGDFLAAGAPGTPAGYFDPTDCDAIEELDSSVAGAESGEAPPTTPAECDVALPEVHPKDPGIGTGAVRCYRYMWKGSDGDDARKQHFRSESDYFIKFGNTLRGVPNHFPYQYSKKLLSNEYFVRDHRYVRPNFQDGGTMDYPRCQPGERFGTSVALFAEFAIANVMYPQLAVGAPFAMDINYMNDSVAMFDGNGTDPTPFGLSDIKRSEDRHKAKYLSSDANFYPYRTGRADLFLGLPKLDGNSNMPAGAGRNKTGSKSIASRRTKPKFEYLDDGRKIIASGANDGGGRESYFIAPNVSGSGLANDNALKSSRKTFGTGGVNFTSSD